MSKKVVMKNVTVPKGFSVEEYAKLTRTGRQRSGGLSPLRVGNSVLIRTVTHYHIGKVVGLTKDEVILSDASWVADTGRFYTALVKGELREVEPFVGNVSVNRGSIIDATEWKHALPRDQK
jgi:hypothetical protein